jgi:DNA modification methylase
MKRVLKPSGSIWVNLGDKYAGSGGPGTVTSFLKSPQQERTGHVENYRKRDAGFVPAKSLMGLPWRYAIGCIDRLGLILRAEVVWSKPNGLPESVTDRVRRSHEQWFHFTKQGRYFAAVDEVREPHTAYDRPRGTGGYNGSNGQTAHGFGATQNPLGKLPGSVWTIPSEPLRIPDDVKQERNLPDHFAAFPSAWPVRLIAGWSPTGICTACGEGRRPVVDRKRELEPGRLQHGLGRTHDRENRNLVSGGPAEASSLHHINTYSITGYACACPEPSAPTTPAVILDPFGGTGTVAMVAKQMGRVGISVDLSADYCRLAEWRIFEDGAGLDEVRRQIEDGAIDPHQIPVDLPLEGTLFSLLDQPPTIDDLPPLRLPEPESGADEVAVITREDVA